MPAIEQQHPTDRVPQSTARLSSGLQNVQCETWGPQATSHSQQTRQTNALDAFGQLTIATSAQADSLRDWSGKPFKEFQPPTGLKIAEKELNQSQGSLNDHVLGIEVGTVKAVYSVGNSVVGIGNAIVSPPARLGDWLANSIKDPAIAVSDSAKFGDDVGKIMVTGINALRSANSYVEEVKQAQSRGDYLKPLVDANHEFNALSDKFKRMTPGQQTESVSEQVVSLGTQIATGKTLASASEAFASLMEKMDAFKVKSDVNCVQFGVENKATPREKIQTERKTQELSATHQEEGEKHFAGARNSRFEYEEIDSYRSRVVPIQCHKNACVAAVGEMLSEGKTDQQTFVRRLELHMHPEQRGKQAPLGLKALSKELGSDWEFKSIDKNTDVKSLLDNLLSRRHPFGVTFKAFGVDAHAVVVDRMNEAGRLVIRDPGDGKIYQMTRNEFEEHWTGLAVAKKIL